MNLLRDLEAYGLRVKLLDGELKISGLDDVKEADKAIVAMLLKEARNQREALIKQLQLSFIGQSQEARVAVNKAFAKGASLEFITEILIKLVGQLTGDMAFQVQNLEALKERGKHG